MINNEVDSLKFKINEMIIIAQNSINLLIEALSAFCNTNHNYKKIVKCSLTLKEFSNTAQSLRDSISEVLKIVDDTLKRINKYLYTLAKLPKKTTPLENFINNVKKSILNIDLKTQEIRVSSNSIAI